MKNKHGFLFGFAVIAIAAMFTLAGCGDEESGDPTSPPSVAPGVTIDSFTGTWTRGYTSELFTVTKVAEADKFTLVYSWGSEPDISEYTYTLSYTVPIADVSAVTLLGKGVPFTGTGTRTSGAGSSSNGTDVGGFFRHYHTIAMENPSVTATPGGYLVIDDDGGKLTIYYEKEGAGMFIDGTEYGDINCFRPE